MGQNIDRPTILIVFGATGDLFKKKLAGALFDLYISGYLPSFFRVIGLSRKPLSSQEFRNQIREQIMNSAHMRDEKTLERFLSHFQYERGDISVKSTYASLGNLLKMADSEARVCANKLFYLAVAPELYRTIFENLASSGLTVPCAPGDIEEKIAWSRVLVEKPFGTDENEARELDALLGSLFREEQIFRIDHYLAKETIQNILAFRFSNGLFEPLWNRKYIEKVEIKLLEAGRVDERGNFYDKIGALRDVGQNHSLMMLALIGMENPGALSASEIRLARSRVLKNIRMFGKKFSGSRGQYEGYQDEKGVAANSLTETSFKTKLEINNRRWRGVPFYIESGKAMPESLSEIIIYFREPKICICPPTVGEHSHQNILTFRIQPNEGITVLFWAKRPGFDFGLDARSLSFSYSDAEFGERRLRDAYERVLFDCIRGDQTLFASTAEVSSEWKVITPISKHLDKIPMVFYKQGTHPFRDNIT